MFLVIDILGGVFSILALVYGSVALDWMTASFFLVACTCDLFILILWVILPRLFPKYGEEELALEKDEGIEC